MSVCPEMWYGVFLWAAVSSLVFHLPAALLSLATLRQHKMARFMPIAILLMGIVGPVCGGVLTSKSFMYLTVRGKYLCPSQPVASLISLVCISIYIFSLFFIRSIRFKTNGRNVFAQGTGQVLVNILTGHRCQRFLCL